MQSGRSTGIVAGVVLPDGTTRVAGSGERATDDRLDGDTVFEIGSITKTFTATLLALMVQDHTVNLDDPVASLLPAGTSVPSRDGRQITLEDLATHTSGLPRNPANLDPKDPDNPYADYTVAQLYDFLGTYAAHDEARLALRVLQRGCRPPRSHARAPRRNVVRRPRPHPDPRAVAHDEHRDHARRGNGGPIRRRPRRPRQGHLPLRHGSARRRRRPPILRERHAEVRGRQPRPARQPTASGDGVGAERRAGPPTYADQKIALSWNVDKHRGNTIIWHGGATGGFFAYIGLDPTHHTAAVVLSNSRAKDIDDIGVHLLDHTQPLLRPAGAAHRSRAVPRGPRPLRR